MEMLQWAAAPQTVLSWEPKSRRELCVGCLSKLYSDTGRSPWLTHSPPHLLLRSLSAASEGACPPQTVRGLQSLHQDSLPERCESQSHSASTGAETRVPPAPMGWRRRRCMCCRATCWSPPSLSGSAPQQMAGRPHSTHRPQPRPGGLQPPLGLQRTAAGIPGQTPRLERLGSCGRAPASAWWLPRGNSGRQGSEPKATAGPSSCSTLERKGPISSTRVEEKRGRHG